MHGRRAQATAPNHLSGQIEVTGRGERESDRLLGDVRGEGPDIPCDLHPFGKALERESVDPGVEALDEREPRGSSRVEHPRPARQ